MSFNNVFAFALLLKKITRKSSLGRKSFQRMRKSTAAAPTTTTTTVTATMSIKKDNTPLSSIHSSDEERSMTEPSQVQIVLKPVFVDNPCNEKELDIKQIDDDTQQTSFVFIQGIEVKVRDFAYSIHSPLHYGKTEITNLENHSAVSLSSPEFNGRDARALFDFIPETEYEIALKAGQTIWVQYRQCPGWLIADVQDETGLIPESYVEFI